MFELNLKTKTICSEMLQQTKNRITFSVQIYIAIKKSIKKSIPPFYYVILQKFQRLTLSLLISLIYTRLRIILCYQINWIIEYLRYAILCSFHDINFRVSQHSRYYHERFEVLKFHG